GPCGIVAKQELTPFASLARSICYQQLHGRAAATIWGRALDVCGGARRFTPKNVLDADDDEMRSAGLSRNKLLAIKDLARMAGEQRRFTWRTLEAMSDDDIIELLTEVRGVGVWTVQMLLIFSLARPDVLPIHDYGVRKGYAVLYKRKDHPTPKELLELGERWRPFRRVASWYLWRAADGAS
ncbi:MAG: DNA-3-methyladenine glycosylase 2 family protein, partial [Deltaproteobacteria bacterium]|nr:DNA-3-methyladenine glycosylase 2 family protein [Deltaproteobacteria bacterium]